MSYKALQNHKVISGLPTHAAKNNRDRVLERSKSIVQMRSLILTILLLISCVGLFAESLTIPNIIGNVALNTNPNDVVLTTVKLHHAITHNIISQLNPESDGSFVFSTNPGVYYLTMEIFRPELGKFSYPYTSSNIIIANPSDQVYLDPTTLTQYSMSMVKVSLSQADPFFKTIPEALSKIQTAVNNGYNGSSATMLVYPGAHIMVSSFDFSYTNQANSSLSLNVTGVSSTGVSIEPQGNYLNVSAHRAHVKFNNIKFIRPANDGHYYLKFHNSSTAQFSFNGCHFGKPSQNVRITRTTFEGISGLSFYNCHIKNNSNLDPIPTVSGSGAFRFLNCSDINIDSSYFSHNEAYTGGAIHISDSEGIMITDSHFSNNSSVQTGGTIPTGTPGGAINVSSSSDLKLLNNQFVSNLTTGAGGAVFLHDTSLFKISNNLFKDNMLYHVGMINSQSDALGFNYCAFTAADTVSHNIIHSGREQSPGSASDFIAIGSSCTGTLNISNGVFIKGIHDLNAYKMIVRSYSPVDLDFVNCVFQTRDMDADFTNLTTPPAAASINVSYSFFDNEYVGTTSSDNTSCNMDDIHLDANYHPIWNSSVISPCIDAGYGENDPDGTPPDIGAIRAISHRYWEYEFRSQADVDRWHWVSYPILNSITNNALKASEFFTELLHKHIVNNGGTPAYAPTYLEEILWVEAGSPLNITWDEDINSWNSIVNGHFVSSPQGYKIKLQSRVNPNYPRYVSLRESGLKTADNHQFPIYGGVENWLGYFSDDARMPQDAFAAIWNDITMIKAKDWSLIRLPKPGNYWGMQGTVMPIKSGDMVIVTTNNNHTFQWGTNNPVPPEFKAEPKSFVYDEKQDYIPVYISIPDSLMSDLKEIGLYVDGVCKGAVVVDDNLEQISAYVDGSDELSEGAVEFVFYYGEAKGFDHQMQAMTLKPGTLQAQYGSAGARYPYFEVKISQDDVHNIVAPEFSLMQNYPNPFNPSTTISYSLPESAKVRLDIFNLKGQLVKTLLNAEKEAGLHSVVWNGKDMNNVAVASGVYFYRISSPNKNQTKRMLLMK